MSTIKDVARVSGVSIATVSRVINNGPKVGDKTRDKVRKVMADLGYTPNANARALVTQTSTTIGVVIPDLTEPFFASLANGVDKIARQQNMQLLLSTSLVSEQSERDAINLLVERRCDAMVVHSKMLSDQELVSFANKVPGLVLIDRFIEQIKHRCIWLDNEEGGRIAARHLKALNHTNVAVITSNYQIDDPQLRLKGFNLALSSEGTKPVNGKPTNIQIESGDPNQQGGEIATQKLLASATKFSALFVYNDAMAIGAISTLEDNGYKVPNDISVIGFDDVLLSRYSRPKLTTLHYPIEEMASQAAQMALSYKNNKVDNKWKDGIKYLPRLVKRQSTTLSTQ